MIHEKSSECSGIGGLPISRRELKEMCDDADDEIESDEDWLLTAENLTYISQEEYRAHRAKRRSQRLDIQKQLQSLRKVRDALREEDSNYKATLKKQQKPRRLQVVRKVLQIGVVVHWCLGYLPAETWKDYACVGVLWRQQVQKCCTNLCLRLVSRDFHHLVLMPSTRWLACLVQDDKWSACWNNWLNHLRKALFDSDDDNTTKQQWLIVCINNDHLNSAQIPGLLKTAIEKCMPQLAALLLRLGAGKLPAFPVYNYEKQSLCRCRKMVNLYLETKSMSQRDILATLMAQLTQITDDHLAYLPVTSMINWMLYEKQTNPFECTLPEGECDCLWGKYRNWFGNHFVTLQHFFLTNNILVEIRNQTLNWEWSHHSLAIPLTALTFSVPNIA